MDFLNITILVVWKLTISFLYEVYINKSILSPLYYDLVQCFSCILADYSQDILNWAIFLIYAYILYKNSYFILMIVVSAHPYKFKMLKYLKENFNIHLYFFFFFLLCRSYCTFLNDLQQCQCSGYFYWTLKMLDLFTDIFMKMFDRCNFSSWNFVIHNQNDQ